MAKNELTVDGRTGLYRRDLGRKVTGGQHRFYLGRDEKKAGVASQRLEMLWKAVKGWFARHRDGEEPVWDETTLHLAQTIANGEFICRVEVPDLVRQMAATDGVWRIHGWLDSLRQAFGEIIGIQLADDELASTAERAQADRGESMHKTGQRILASVGKASTGETLHRAIDAYITWLEGKFMTPPEEGQTQRTSQTGKKQSERAARLKEHHKNVALADFGAKEIDAMIDYWAKRPKMQKKGHYSFWTCKHQIRLIKHFIKWLHKNPEFAWKKPTDYEFDRVSVLTHPHEVAARLTAEQVQTFSREEIKTLWEYATPLERVFLCLGLNCGFNISEMSTLREDEIHDGSTIKRLRHKSKVYGQWKLWPITQEAIRWALERKAHLGIKSPLVLTTDSGLSYIAPTAKNNRGAKIPNAWNRLIDRIQEDHEKFRRLSIGKLRKTAADMIRRFSDGEIAAIFLCHGKSVKTDELAENYTNRPFDKVFAAQDRVWEFLKDVLVGEFPPQEATKPSAKISLGTIRKIQSLRRQGFKVSKVAEICEVAESTVREHCKNLTK